MRHPFYDFSDYRSKQSEKTKRNQESGLYEHLKKREIRTCSREGCIVSFSVQRADPKQYCSQSCAATVSNAKRKWSKEVKLKISLSMKGNTNTLGLVRFEPLRAECEYIECKKIFSHRRYLARRFCSVQCAMKVTGSKPTSPKASRGKAGVRLDIDPNIYFYSRWEANVARLYTYLGIKWTFEPKTFDIGNQMYTPDFYLLEEDTYIEVKNFWSRYSRIRDAKFRESYPNIRLQVILKEDYLALEERYARHIPLWEYKSSSFTP